MDRLDRVEYREVSSDKVVKSMVVYALCINRIVSELVVYSQLYVSVRGIVTTSNHKADGTTGIA